MFAIAKKLNMTQLFTRDGKFVPVTVLEIPKNKVSKILSEDNDGYRAVQLESEGKHAEFRLSNDSGDYKPDQEIAAGDFAPGQILKVTGTSKGRGFAGFIKRHGFHGMPKSHGHERQRIPGSIGQAFPQHVRKGLRMAGQMGNVTVTEINLFIVAVDAENSRIFVKGSIPGPVGGLLKVVTTGKEKQALNIVSFVEETSEQAKTQEEKPVVDKNEIADSENVEKEDSVEKDSQEEEKPVQDNADDAKPDSTDEDSKKEESVVEEGKEKDNE